MLYQMSHYAPPYFKKRFSEIEDARIDQQDHKDTDGQTVKTGPQIRVHTEKIFFSTS